MAHWILMVTGSLTQDNRVFDRIAGCELRDHAPNERDDRKREDDPPDSQPSCVLDDTAKKQQ